MPKRRPKLPLRVQCILQKLGADIEDARKRRRIPVLVMAERSRISHPTLKKIERGDPGVAIGFYAAVLFVLGLEHRLGEIADPGTDELGLALEGERLPERIRWPSHSKSGSEGDAQ